MSGAETINYNGVELDHACCTIRIGGIAVTGIKSISFSHGRDGEKLIYGTSTQPIARTRGQYKPEDVSIEFYRSAFTDLLKRTGDGWMEKTNDIVIEAVDPASGSSFIDKIKAFKPKKNDFSSQEGGDPHMKKLNGSCMLIVENGTLPMNGMSQ